MANTDSNLATAQAAALRAPASAPKPAVDYGKLLVIRGKVTCPATPSTSDTLTLIPAEMLPVGAVYAPEESWLYCEGDPGGALTLDVGPASNPDLLADALALTVIGTSSGRINFLASGTKPDGVSTLTAVAEQEAVLATVKVSTSVVETVIQFGIAFRVNG
jgi:hypothetical protein